jgi:pimeloyl-ACP methyl ester carboxylesterase
MSQWLAPPVRTAPDWGMFARELATAISPRRFIAPADVPARNVGQGRPVLVIPGFLASDLSTRPLRLGLRHAGFRAHGWKQGRNVGLSDNIFDIIDARVRHIARGEPVALVGWSLGGLIAREYAKVAPQQIERVVTLGSPICGDPRQNNNVWRIYEFVAGHPVDAPPVDCKLDEKPPVETVAIWSRRDGIVAADSACADGCADRSIEIGCNHMEMAFSPQAIRAVVKALA